MKRLLAHLLRRWTLHREIRDEIDFHLEMRTHLNRASGLSPEDARQAAKKLFGNADLIIEDTRQAHFGLFWQSFGQDLRYACRSLIGAPAFTLSVLIALALGLGSATAVFSVVDRILFRSLPYANEDRLVSIGVMAPLDTSEFLLAADYQEWKRADTPFEMFGSFVAGGSPGGAGCDLTDDRPMRLSCAFVDSTFLPTLGVQPVVGRNFTEEEDGPNGTRVALISFALWRDRFGSDASTIGRSISLDGRPTRIIGVLPQSFEMPTLAPDDVLLAQALTPSEIARPQTGPTLRAFARMKPGVTITQAHTAMESLFQQSLQWVPAAYRSEVKLQIRSIRDRQIAGSHTASWLLLGAVVAVLIIACANIANLLLARGSARSREFAMRTILGASRRRLIRQLLTESALLAVFGGIAGCFLAWSLLQLFVAIAPAGIPRLLQASLDLRVLLFALGLALVCGLLFGLAPAFLSHSGAEKSRGVGSPGSIFRHMLVVTQIAASLILLTSAGLLLRSLWNLQSVSLGMETNRVITASMTLGQQRYSSTQSRLDLFRQLEDRVSGVPQIESFAVADSVPLLRGGNSFSLFASIEVLGRNRLSEGTGGTVTRRAVTENYFASLGIPIIRGRSFSAQDRMPDQAVVVISELLARRLFPADDALGMQIRWGFEGPWRTIVGIARDVKNNRALSGPDEPEIYVPRQPTPATANRRLLVILRTTQPLSAVAETIRTHVEDLDPTLPVTVETMDAQLEELTAQPRFNAFLLSFFSFVGLSLAAIGLYGVISFVVSRKTAEIGIRVALGATSQNIVYMVLSSTARATLVGVALGLAGSLLVTRMLNQLLFKVNQHDPRTFITTLCVLLVVAMFAAWLPSRRASRLDPLVALRKY